MPLIFSPFSLREYFYLFRLSSNICPLLIDFMSRRNETYFLCRFVPFYLFPSLVILPFLPFSVFFRDPRLPYLSYIRPIVSSYCTMFFHYRGRKGIESSRQRYPRGHNKPSSFAQSVSVALLFSNAKLVVVVVYLTVVVFTCTSSELRVSFLYIILLVETYGEQDKCFVKNNSIISKCVEEVKNRKCDTIT